MLNITRYVAAVSLSAVALVLGGCAASPRVVSTQTLRVMGAVHGGQQPVTGSLIQLYAAGTTGDGSAATPLVGTTVTTSDGSGNGTNASAGNNFNQLAPGFFTLTGAYTCPASSSETYLVSTGGNPGLGAGATNSALAMIAALGPCGNLNVSTFVSINELTTVGTVAALAPYMTSFSAIGSGASDLSQFQTAFSNVNQYVNTAAGTVPGPALQNSSYASSYEIATLGNVLSSCINSSGGSSCDPLFSNTTPSGGPAPTETVGAMLNIVKNPAQNVCALYNLQPPSPPFQPTLSACPANWALSISTLTVSVSGASSVYVGQAAQFSVTVTGTGNQSVTWSVNGVAGGNATVGTITSGGLYTPPSSASPTSPVSIAATSVLSSTAVGSASLAVAPVTVAISGPTSVLFGQTGQYSAVVTGNSTQTVTWSVNGGSAQGTISSTGLYTAPASVPPTPVKITATSTAVSTGTGTFNVILANNAVTPATGDSRTVTQPSYPAVCATLFAQFTSSQRATPPTTDDTSRIQAALNTTACKNTGQAVVLAPSGSNNAFYSSLLTLNGEGLTLNSGVTLYGNTAYQNLAELILIKGNNSSLMGPGIVDGRGDILSSGVARLVQATAANNLILYNVTLQQSIKPNLYVEGGNGFTAWGISILTPATRTNADGIDIDSLTNATVTNSSIEAGDDGVAIKTNSAAISNVTISNNHLYGTHGLSIGSQTFNGVSNILFTGNYVNGTDLQGNVSANANGINIKTDPTCGGLVQQVTYQNTCMQNVKHLIILNTNYGTCSGNPGTPQYKNILINGAFAQTSVAGAYSQFTGQNASVPIDAHMAYVSLDSTSQQNGQYATVALSNSNLVPAGTGVTITPFSITGSVPACSF